MIRITNLHAGWLLMWLRGLKQCAPNIGSREIMDLEALRLNRLEDNGEENLSPEDLKSSSFLGEILDGAPQVDVEEIIKPVEKQLVQPEGQETRLIDLLVEVLCNPMQRHILAGRTLKALRKALLTFDERNGLEEKISRAHTHCGSCGHELQSGEMLTIRSKFEDGKLEWVLACTRCVLPHYFACRSTGCDQAVMIPEGKLKWISMGAKSFCEEHKENKQPATISPAALPGAYRLMGNMFQADAPLPVWNVINPVEVDNE